MSKAAGQTNKSAKLQWTEDVEGAFQALKGDLKGDLKSAPALGISNYSKPFNLYEAERASFDRAVTPTEKQQLAYFSTKIDAVEQGLTPCSQGLAAAAFAYQKASTLTMGHPVMLYT